MKTKLLSVLLFLALAFGALAPVTTAQAASTVRAPGLLQFTANGHALGFTAQGLYVASGSHALQVNFLNANPIQPQAETASQTGQATPLSRVTYTNLWPGIDLTYSASGESLYTTTYSLAPGADAGQIQLHYNAPVTLNPNGTLSLAFKTGKMTESAPLAWQDINGKRMPVEVSFRVEGRQVGFALGAYDPHYSLTIDPSLTWHTFLGGNDADVGTAIAVDGSGNIYVTGYSDAGWQGANPPVRPFNLYNDAFVAKLDSSGALLWNTFLGGGSGNDYGNAIAVNGSDIYVAGNSDATWSPSLMVPPVRPYSGGSDAFAARLNSSGVLQWNTFLGGTGYDVGTAIAVDGSGNLYVAGNSNATWQGANPPVRAYTAGGFYDAFAAKLTSSGALTWNTFLGGSANDRGNGIVVDGSGNSYVAGYGDTTWQGANPPVRAYATGGDAFAAKLNNSGVLTWNTFLGGTGDDRAYALTADGSENVYIAGYSTAAWGSPVQPYIDRDAFAVKLDSSGGLTWNTFVGGSGDDSGNAIAVDGNGNVYLTGDGNATWGSPIRAYTAGYDTFAVRLNNNGALGVNTFLGGSGDDTGYGLAVDANQNVYVIGYSNATWGSNPVRPYAGGMYDAFVAKVDLPPSVVSVRRANPSPTFASSVSFTVTFSESVTGVDTAAPFNDFTLTTSGITGAAISAVSGSSSLYTVTVNTGSGNGTIRLDLPASATIPDLAGNPLVGLPYTSGETYAVDKTAPTVDTFTATTPISNRNIPITAFTASDTAGVTGYKITESSTAPAAGDTGWSGTAPTTYTVGSAGTYTLYPWTKDAAGNVSSVFGSPRTVEVSLRLLSIADFNGDGLTDVSIFRPSTGQWFVKDQFAAIWGVSTDIPTPGDYNGDGKTDVAIYRPTTGQWFVKDQFAANWGVSTDIPTPGDYNGDGKADVAIYRPSTGQWFVKDQFAANWGVSTDIPVPGDYNGDGKADIAIYRPSTGQWFVKDQFAANWGVSTDIPVPGDYNGDGTTDIAIYRPSTGQWFVKDQFAANWGVSSDIPVPGDYNGDGKADIAIYRPSTGQWFVKDQFAANWGVSSDFPLPAPDTNGDGDPYQDAAK